MPTGLGCDRSLSTVTLEGASSMALAFGTPSCLVPALPPLEEPLSCPFLLQTSTYSSSPSSSVPSPCSLC